MEFRKYNVGYAFFAEEYFAEIDGKEVKLHKELIYLGQDGSAFYVEYREYDQSCVGNPFKLQLTYSKPTTEPALISFRTTGFKVNSATNEHIEVAGPM